MRARPCWLMYPYWPCRLTRLGVVWDPTGEGKQTIRAAFGPMVTQWVVAVSRRTGEKILIEKSPI